MKKVLAALITMILIAAGSAGAQASSTSARVDPVLQQLFSTRLPGTSVPVVITYTRMPGSTEFGRLRTAGILKGFALKHLPMVICDMNAAQLSAVRSQPNVASVWANQVMQPYTNASRHIIGVPQMMADREIQARNTTNPGFPISGRGIGIGYIDTGIDATHKDLEYGTKVVQNVIQPLSQGVVGDGGLVIGVGISIADLIAGTGFVPPIYVENQMHSDVESGHGTHGAAVAAGTGAMSGGFYGGVAQGAHLVGLNAGNELGLPLVAILGAFDYLLANQYQYNIRIINNSWGGSLSPGGIDPFNPINVATRTAHDRNIVVVFAAGNSGDTPTSINPYSTMPWTISVAAGEKQGLGTPAGFSSRGVNNGTGTDVTTQPADPHAAPNLRPDITAPGVDIKSARMKGVGLTNTVGTIPIFVGANDLSTIPPAFLPFYTTSQGTSFACPHVSGIVALMLEANPLLTPAEVVTILRQTATPMPYEERVVGAGYADAHNAVRAALSLSAVPHPVNLFPVDDPNAPQIVDGVDDQLGTTAQDIRAGHFRYDAAANQIVYTLTLTDLSVTTPNMRWTMVSKFGETEVFVTASVNELDTTYKYGRITTLATGTRNQETIGDADAGQMNGDRIIIRLSLDKVNAAVGSNVLNTTSTGTAAQSQILIGTSASGGLLLNSDSANGADFHVGEQSNSNPTPDGSTPDTTAEPDAAGKKFDERYSGAVMSGQNGTDIPFSLRRSMLDARITFHPGNEQVAFDLVGPDGQTFATSNGGRISLEGLAPGLYVYRVRGFVGKGTDFTIKSTQGR